jgi:RNA polymerase sigma-70 factor (ECF subfamily)
MRGWWARAETNTALRSEEPRNRFVRRTARWFGRTPAVPASRFQDADEPFPRHWRSFPEPWPERLPADVETRDALGAAIEQLPSTWREVLIARDALDADPADVGERLDLTARQQRLILNRARARLRDQLARRFGADA